ncbi:hypothetical protein CS379_09660 [Methylobacterium frigidaeris]|uniref:Uncharacterized protein n=1 Tax=Methylobacterium frigidaeris TaxID=2038277 RepID=A0AA37HIM7_9HYPH|nr:hypothetical protein [Methylobacterium frigidaeris]PIK73217.1 hypothetical protein CS379_09660 [Methylobacterium frigidaeris]GJD66433.1 hypothetical protein MPEAHAMD_6631 [Methylobacterium frigidaeris]
MRAAGLIDGTCGTVLGKTTAEIAGAAHQADGEVIRLVIRGCGPVGYPGSAEVVNMAPRAS